MFVLSTRGTYYRHTRPKAARLSKKRKASSLALTAAERDEVAALLDSPKFADKAPPAVYAELLDEGRYA